MKKTAFLVLAALLASASLGLADSSRHTFTIQARSIRGAATGEISMNGGGVYDPTSGFLQGGGGFRCLQDVEQGPLKGLRAGEGVHWEAFQILPSTGFKCGSLATEPLKTAVTDDNTLVMKVQFFRAGDGATPSFTANVFVSAQDEDLGADGTQKVWIQQVGCEDDGGDVR